MTESDLVPVFDGHNDTLLRLYQSKDTDAEKLFIEGNRAAISTCRAPRPGAFAGGMFAIFPPPVEKTRRSAVPLAPSDTGAVATRGSARRCAQLDDRDGLHPVQAGTGRCADRLPQRRRCARREWRKGRSRRCSHNRGVEAIDPELTMLDVLHAAGLRSLGIVWSRPNAFGHGVPFRFPSSPDTGPA